jgi:uroporphyrinogen-III synthase
VAPAAADGYVLLLRAPRDSDPYVAAFEAAGYEVECLPLLEYEFVNEGALAEALAAAEGYAGMVLTSPRALDAIAASEAARAEVRARWAGKPAFAVGPETAARARALGLAVWGEEAGTSAGLAALIAAEIGQNTRKRLLFPAGEPRRTELIQGLAAHGIDVHEVVVYTARPRSDLGLPPGRPPGWVVFFSPRGVDLTAEALTLPWERVRKAAIGPTTARALADRGWTPEAVAEAPTPAALVAAVARYSA